LLAAFDSRLVGDIGKIYATIGLMVEIREYRELDGRSRFGEWRSRLDAGPRRG
jgi:hypothetical protein